MTWATRLLTKIEAAIEQNQLALRAAVDQENEEVVQLCAAHHFRLRAIEDHLTERLAR